MKRIIATTLCTRFEPLTIEDILRHDRLRSVLVFCVWAAMNYPKMDDFSNEFADEFDTSAHLAYNSLCCYLSDEKDKYLKRIAEEVIQQCEK